jgi:hypothetical protein
VGDHKKTIVRIHRPGAWWGAAAVGGADDAHPETAGRTHLARPGAVVAAAVAAAELVLAAFIFRQASRLILLLSLSGRVLPRLGITL